MQSMKKIAICCMAVCTSLVLTAQNYSSYFTGNLNDLNTQPLGGVCLMGGATEDDNAMRWFLERADGGDVLVIRASGADGYNDYFYNQLGVNINSVETIVFNNASAANETYVLQRLEKAEAIWIAGGNQANYVNFWRNTEVANLINEGIQQRNIVIGGTSAGMAILGGAYFSAVNGTVNSSTALSNPYTSALTVENTPFIEVPYLDHVITDTHYDNPDRRGRHMAFLARAITDYGGTFRGIACDEYTAVCIDENGIASIYGTYPDFDDNAYFLVPNCGIPNNTPETCSPGQPLSWNQGGAALKVYQVKGTPTGLYTFDLNDWSTAEGGDWQDWSVNAGALTTLGSEEPDCLPSSTYAALDDDSSFKIYPNPNSQGVVTIEPSVPTPKAEVRVINLDGSILQTWTSLGPNSQLDVSRLPAGTYYLEYRGGRKRRSTRRLMVR